MTDATPIGWTHYMGPKTFRSWDNAIAYALLPAAPGYHATQRRLVLLGSAGRWVVGPTTAPRRLFRADPLDNGHYPSPFRR